MVRSKRIDDPSLGDYASHKEAFLAELVQRIEAEGIKASCTKHSLCVDGGTHLSLVVCGEPVGYLKLNYTVFRCPKHGTWDWVGILAFVKGRIVADKPRREATKAFQASLAKNRQAVADLKTEFHSLPSKVTLEADAVGITVSIHRPLDVQALLSAISLLAAEGKV